MKKSKIRQWIRRLILWAASDYYEEATERLSAELRTQLHHSRDHLKKENKCHWDMLNAKITALQAIDVSMKDEAGKLIIMASVKGQDIVKIMDIPRSFSLEDHRRLIQEMEGRYGARQSFVDAPTSAKRMLDEMAERERYYRPAKRGGTGHGW